MDTQPAKEEPATTEEEAVAPKPPGPGGSREERWGQASGEMWDQKRSGELEGSVLDKSEVWSKLKKGGMSAEELDSWASDNNVKMNKKAQAFLDAKLGRSSTGGGEGTGTGTGGSSGSTEGGDAESGGGGGAGGNNEGGVTDTEGQNTQTSANSFKYRPGKYTYKPRDYGAVASSIQDEALLEADERDLGELTELRKSIDRAPLYWKARSDVQTGDYLGDIWNFDTPEFKMPKPMSPVEGPDIGGISGDWADRIDSIKPQL